MGIKEAFRSNEYILREFARKNGGIYIKASSGSGEEVVFRKKDYDVHLKYLRFTDGKIISFATEIHIVLNGEEKFRFSIRNKSIYKTIKDRFFLNKTNIINDNEVYKKFYIKTNDYIKMKYLLDSPKLKYLITGQNRLNVFVDNKEERRILMFREFGLIRSMRRLKQLLIMMEEMAEVMEREEIR